MGCVSEREIFQKPPQRLGSDSRNLVQPACLDPDCLKKARIFFSYPVCELWRAPVITLCAFKRFLECCSVFTRAAVAFNSIKNT